MGLEFNFLDVDKKLNGFFIDIGVDIEY